MELIHCAGAVGGSLIFDSAIFEVAEVERWIKYFERLVHRATEDPDATLRTLPLHSDAEYYKVLHQFNATAETYPGGHCIHHLVEMQAVESPHAICLEWKRSRLTYQQLVERSRLVATWLLDRSAVPDSVVALHLRRSLEQVVGMLGTLMSGSAYLPLDVNWPHWLHGRPVVLST